MRLKSVYSVNGAPALAPGAVCQWPALHSQPKQQ